MELQMKTTTRATLGTQREEQNLHHRYGEIGISAVAAAIAYQSECKNLKYAPVEPSDQHHFDAQRFIDRAA
jgi:hypothetical protein